MPSDPDRFVRFTVLLFPHEHAEAVAAANAREISVSELIRRALKLLLQHDEAEVERITTKKI